MTMTTHVRFLDPIDPRLVWKHGMELVWPKDQHKDEYRWTHTPRDPDDRWKRNAEWWGKIDQGAEALMWMRYGHEGSLLIDDDDCDDCEPDPPAYVELCFDTPYRYEPQKMHDGYFMHLLLSASTMQPPVRVAWYRGECCSWWHDRTQKYLAELRNTNNEFQGMIPRIVVPQQKSLGDPSREAGFPVS